MILGYVFSIIIVAYLGIVLYSVITNKEIDTGSFILGAVLSAISSVLYLLGMIAGLIKQNTLIVLFLI